MRYLFKAHIQNAMRNRQSVEQFLRYTKIDGKKILSWLSLKKRNGEYVLLHHKQHDEGSLDNVNIYHFKYLHLPKDSTEPQPVIFTNLDAALNHASTHLGASNAKWVSEGMIQEEYNDFKLTDINF